MDLKYGFRSLKKIYEAKADRICELYAIKIRMTAPRAIEVRYGFPFTEQTWPMVGLSTAEHSFVMAQMIVPMYMEFLDLFADRNIPVEMLESEALHHDDAEALTGDAATDVDGITREMKDAAELKSIDRQYHNMVCQSYMRMRHNTYEAKGSYASKIVKMCDAVDLVLFAQYCVRNGIGMISKNAEGKFVIDALGKPGLIDERAYGEIKEPYFTKEGRTSVPVSEIMYDHSLPRLQKLKQPELINLFKLLCARAFKFPFEQYNLTNLPMDFAKMA